MAGVLSFAPRGGGGRSFSLLNNHTQKKPRKRSHALNATTLILFLLGL